MTNLNEMTTQYLRELRRVTERRLLELVAGLALEDGTPVRCGNP